MNDLSDLNCEDISFLNELDISFLNEPATNLLKRHAAPMTEEEVISKCEKQMPQNTINHSRWAMKAFNDWRNARVQNNIMNPNMLHVFKEPKEMTKLDLNFLLKFFVHEVRKQNGEKYPRDSLKQLIAGIQFYFRHYFKITMSIFTDIEFSETRTSLDSAMKEACQENRGVHKKKQHLFQWK